MKVLTSYSDFPVPDDFPNYMHHSKFLAYVRMYASQFQLEQYIRFEREVVSIEPLVDDAGRWSVTTSKMSDFEYSQTEVFDAVLVCAGINSHVNMGCFEGQNDFKGQLMHSSNFRQAYQPCHLKIYCFTLCLLYTFHFLLFRANKLVIICTILCVTIKTGINICHLSKLVVFCENNSYWKHCSK